MNKYKVRVSQIVEVEAEDETDAMDTAITQAIENEDWDTIDETEALDERYVKFLSPRLSRTDNEVNKID